MNFDWNTIQYDEQGKVFLLWRFERIFQEFKDFSSLVVCDIGSWGHLPERFEQEGATCWIMDNLTEEQYYPDRVKEWPRFVQWDVSSQVPTDKKNYFDFVTCFEVMEHVENQLLGFIRLHQLLKPGGWLIGTFPIPGGTHQLGDPTVKGWMSDTDIENVLLGLGMRNVTVEPTASINKEDRHVSYYFKAQK
jgi:2-polyprenyl-3-methyl-5-hydroxy-6-metoxy-1,4-benzoquinol methylase